MAKKSLISTLVATVFWLGGHGVAHAGLQDEMNNIFGSMSNYTEPGVYETQRRGVLTGGNFTMKTKISRTNIMNAQLPSFEAGCGGIQLNGGSFSYINLSEIVDTLRRVGANSAGVFFQVAMHNVAPNLASNIEAFQKKLQALNQMFLDSCQLAQGIVNESAEALNFNAINDTRLTTTAAGIFSDGYEAFTSLGQTHEQAAKTAAPTDSNAAKSYELLVGNIMWDAMKSVQVDAWYSSGNTELLETIMSISGTTILHEQDAATGDKDETILTGSVTLQNLIVGGGLKIYDCSRTSVTDKCLIDSSDTKDINLTGYDTMIREAFMGNQYSIGIIKKFQHNNDTLTAQEKNLLVALPQGLGGLMQRVSILSPDSANTLAASASKAIALEMSYLLVTDMLRSSRTALYNSRNPRKSELIERIRDVEQGINNEYQMLVQSYGTTFDFIERYQIVMNATSKNQYTKNLLTSGGIE